MLPDWVSNPGPLTYESGALLIALHGPAHGPVILPCISDSIKYKGIILQTLVQSDSVNDIIQFAGYCGLYFMVQ